MVFVHRRPAASSQQHGLRLHEHEFATAHVDHQHAGDRVAQESKRRTGAQVRTDQHARDRPHQQIAQQTKIHVAEAQVPKPREQRERDDKHDKLVARYGQPAEVQLRDRKQRRVSLGVRTEKFLPEVLQQQ